MGGIPANQTKSSRIKSPETTTSLRHLKNVISFRKPPAVIRRDPVVTSEQILNDNEARSRVTFAVEKFPPGEPNRWAKILNIVNINDEPTEEIPDPLEIIINLDQLKDAVSTICIRKTSADFPDETVMLNSFMGTLYKKHSAERGQRISCYERDSRKILDTEYAYSEIDYREFATILLKIITTFGLKKSGAFCDLGCGVGQLVYAACIVGNFQKCMGIEILDSLIDRGEKRKKQWISMTAEDFIPEKLKTTELVWIRGNFLEHPEFTKTATFIFMNWTAFSALKRKQITVLLDRCVEGSFCVTLTHPLTPTSSKFELLFTDVCKVSWGNTNYFVHEKTRSDNS